MRQNIMQSEPRLPMPHYLTHARKRMDQRAIPERVVETLLRLANGTMITSAACAFMYLISRAASDSPATFLDSEPTAAIGPVTRRCMQSSTQPPHTARLYVITVARRERGVKFK